jgi:hypothetical protein
VAAYFAVITKVSDDLSGNYACAEMLINPDANAHTAGANIIVNPPSHLVEKYFGDAIRRKRNDPIDLTKKQLVFCNTPVFTVGEILIMNSNDRTIPDGRKPDKWDVEYETFTDIDSAAKRAKEVYEDK